MTNNPVLRHDDNVLTVDLTPLVAGRLQETHLSADISASSGTLTVKDISGFSTGQYVLIGELGSENSEIIATHASTTPSGTTITLAANTTWAHSAGEKVYRIQWNQIEFSHASTASGSKSVLSTEAIQPDQKIQGYVDTSQTSGFYFARFKDSVGTTYSSYTDALAFGGWASSTVGYMIESALANARATLSDSITRRFCYDQINECMRLIQGKQIRWPQHQSLNTILGQSVRGTHQYSLPSDIYDNDTNKSILAIRVGEDQKLEYLDPLEFEQALADAKYTQVRTEASANDTSLAVDNSYDFDDSGTLVAYYSGSKDSFTYTGVTRDDADGGTAAFTGIPSSGDNAIGDTIIVDTWIWQDEQEGEPEFFTVRNGNLEIWPLPDGSHDNFNIYADYWTVATEVDSDGDAIDIQRYDMVLDYLTWKVRMQKHNEGALDMSDGYYLQFKEKLNDAIRTKRSGITHKMKPKLNKISYGWRGGRVRPDPNDY